MMSITSKLIYYSIQYRLSWLGIFLQCWRAGLGRSPGEGKGYPPQYSGLENSMDCNVLRVAKSRTHLSNFHFTQAATKLT